MNRLCIILLVALFLSSTIGRLGKNDAENSLHVWAENAMTRVGRHDAVKKQKNIHIYAARNEWEAFQIIVSATGENLRIVNVEVSDLVKNRDAAVKISTENIYLYREHYVHVNNSSPFSPCSSGFIPDALIPFKNPYTGEELNGFLYDAIPFDLTDGQSQPIWVDVFVPENTQPGEYTGHVIVESADGQSDTMSLTLTVWNFTLPSFSSLNSSFSVGRQEISRYYDLDVYDDAEKFFPLIRKYYDFLMKHYLMPDFPMDTFPDLDEETGDVDFSISYPGLGNAAENLEHYFEEGMRIYRLPIWESWPYPNALTREREKTKRYVAQYGEYLALHGWEGKLYTYIIDEPDDAEAYQKTREWGSLFDEVEEEYGVQIDFLVTEQPVPDNVRWGSLISYVDIWCPIACEVWLDEDYYKTHVISSRISAGDKVWCYTALVQPSREWWEIHGRPSVLQGDYPPVWLLDYPPMNYRVYPWLYHLYNITGMLYWETCYWKEADNPWSNPATVVRQEGSYNGDGMLIYPGKADEIGFDGPVASMRLKWLRDGIEDYEYIRMLRETDSTKAEELLHKVAGSMVDWEMSPSVLYDVRREIGMELNVSSGIFVNTLKPKENCLYISDREIMAAGDTIIVGEITLKASTNGNRVEFYIDDKQRYVDNNPPYEWLWDERTIGRHEIKVVAYDSEGNRAEDEMKVVIFNFGVIK